MVAYKKSTPHEAVVQQAGGEWICPITILAKIAITWDLTGTFTVKDLALKFLEQTHLKNDQVSYPDTAFETVGSEFYLRVYVETAPKETRETNNPCPNLIEASDVL